MNNSGQQHGEFPIGDNEITPDALKHSDLGRPDRLSFPRGVQFKPLAASSARCHESDLTGNSHKHKYQPVDTRFTKS